MSPSMDRHHQDEQAQGPIDQYLDGQMDDEQRQSFEQRMTAEPHLEAAVDAQRQIDQSLRRLYDAPSAQSTWASIELAASQPAVGQLAWWRPSRRVAVVIMLAAAVALAAVLWLAMQRPRDRQYNKVAKRNMTQEYYFQVRSGFEPGWICETDQQFASTFWYRLRQGLLLKAPPTNIAALGLSYAYVLSPRSIVLLAKVDNQPVIVLVDHLQRDLAGAPDLPAGLHLHRRQLRTLVLYELTPLDQPHVLDLFYEPDMPESWKRPPVFD